jgi:tRNA(Glu) U13 pseudouridine synthase TruD
LGQIQDPYTYVTLTREEFIEAARKILRDYEIRQAERAKRMMELELHVEEAVRGDVDATSPLTMLVLGDPEQLQCEFGRIERMIHTWRVHLLDTMLRDIDAAQKNLQRLYDSAAQSMIILQEFLGVPEAKQ